MKFANKRLRHELKYYIAPNEYEALRRRVATVMRLDRNSIGNEGYHIRSLYFDNINETALFDKNNGAFQRKKYRIRIYNRSDAVIKLERKSKFNEFTAKESASLTREQFDSLMVGESQFLLESGDLLMREFYYDLLHGQLKPSVVVDYIREAYIYPVSDVRITFDKQLQAGVQSFDIFDPDLVTLESIDGPRQILEVKYNQFLPDFIKHLIQLSSHNRSTISKYVLCKEKQKVFTG
ncbi:polyphosphate polymerase domain-containing protein [Paenibacillus bovis]|uniref:Vacuolar transporter n=1 Tax=Paenibacillus bovis TaxID=1616788 RepID=A0A172ZBA5_9BACL|nr:polyphosphate polymerase domain-containing protein [Paenibacillus bovis]ANF94926.1 vacuolar transporter [Paenibacillus bovis]